MVRTAGQSWQIGKTLGGVPAAGTLGGEPQESKQFVYSLTTTMSCGAPSFVLSMDES